MGTGGNGRRAALSWLLVAGLFALCGVLGVLQYRWIGEVSVAARDRLRGSLQASLNRLSQDFSGEIGSACQAVMPGEGERDIRATELEVAERYAQFRKTARHGQIFRHIALVEARGGALVLRELDLEKFVFQNAAWPADWEPVKAHLESLLSPDPRRRRGLPGSPAQDHGTVFDLPAFGNPAPRGEADSFIFDLNPAYLRDSLLPELVQRHLETGGTLEFAFAELGVQPS